MMFTVAVGIGPFAGVLALVMFSLAIMGKLLSETIDSIDPDRWRQKSYWCFT